MNTSFSLSLLSHGPTDKAQLCLFGSSKNGFGFRDSDLDICMTLEGHDTAEVDRGHTLARTHTWAHTHTLAHKHTLAQNTFGFNIGLGNISIS